MHKHEAGEKKQNVKKINLNSVCLQNYCQSFMCPLVNEMTENAIKGAIHKNNFCNGWGWGGVHLVNKKQRDNTHRGCVTSFSAPDVMAPVVLYIGAKMFFFSVALISSFKLPWQRPEVGSIDITLLHHVEKQDY